MLVREGKTQWHDVSCGDHVTGRRAACQESMMSSRDETEKDQRNIDCTSKPVSAVPTVCLRRVCCPYRSGRSRGGHMVVYEKLGGVDMRTLRREKGVTVPMLLR